MEGRAIARPNLARSKVSKLERLASMEGRAIARPNLSEVLAVERRLCRASMEGRAIARPNLPHRRLRTTTIRASMEGRAIARPNPVRKGRNRSPASWLQWRAGQLPGQTYRPDVGALQPTLLQWRAGQLPGQTTGPGAPDRPARKGFNGGPGNCPAKPHNDDNTTAK